MLGNGWKKYYIDPVDVKARRRQNDAAVVGGGGGGAPFERGSSQRVTLPLAAAAGVRESTAGGILVNRCDQPGLQRTQPGRR